MLYKVSNIIYDTDKEDINLPKTVEITIPDDIEDIEDYLRDEISNVTGFCHFGFDFTAII